MITEQNGILTPTPHPCLAVLVSPTTRVVPLPPQLLPLPTFLPLMATSTSSDPTSDSSSKSLIFTLQKLAQPFHPTLLITSHCFQMCRWGPRLISDLHMIYHQWKDLNGNLEQRKKRFFGSSRTVIQSGWNQTT